MTVFPPTLTAHLQLEDVIFIQRAGKYGSVTTATNDLALAECDDGTKWVVADVLLPWHFVSRPGVTAYGYVPDPRPPPFHVEHLGPLPRLRGTAGSHSYHDVHVVSAMERVRSWVRRNMREWPYGKAIDFTIDGDMLEARWISEASR